MKNQELRELLEEHSKVQAKIEKVAHKLYEKRNNLMRKIVPEIISRKAGDIIGLPTVPMSIRFKDGRTWTLRPSYTDKGGAFKGTVFKAYGVDLFTITEKGEKK